MSPGDCYRARARAARHRRWPRVPQQPTMTDDVATGAAGVAELEACAAWITAVHRGPATLARARARARAAAAAATAAAAAADAVGHARKVLLTSAPVPPLPPKTPRLVSGAVAKVGKARVGLICIQLN